MTWRRNHQVCAGFVSPRKGPGRKSVIRIPALETWAICEEWQWLFHLNFHSYSLTTSWQQQQQQQQQMMDSSYNPNYHQHLRLRNVKLNDNVTRKEETIQHARKNEQKIIMLRNKLLVLRAQDTSNKRGETVATITGSCLTTRGCNNYPVVMMASGP